MGKETISSQELAEYTHINSTQIRRDLSGFGKFGKRGVGYRVESLVSEIRKILRTAGQHNIALFGAGNLGQAIASSDIFADHGFQIVAVFDVDQERSAATSGGVPVRDFAELERVVEDEEVVVGVLAVPRPPPRRSPTGSSRPASRSSSTTRAAPPGAARGDRPHLEPRRGPALRALLLPRLTRSEWVSDATLDLRPFASASRRPRTSRSGSRRSSRSSIPTASSSTHRFEDLYAACQEDELLAASAAGELIDTEIEIRSGRGESFAEAVAMQREHRARLFALAERLGLGLAAMGHPSVGELPRPADHRHRPLQPAAR